MKSKKIRKKFSKPKKDFFNRNFYTLNYLSNAKKV